MKKLLIILLLINGLAFAQKEPRQPDPQSPWRPVPEIGNRGGWQRTPHPQVSFAIVDSSRQANQHYRFMRISRWDDECIFSVNLPENNDSLIRISNDSTKILLGYADRWLEWYEREDGCSEFEIILRSRPLTDTITFLFTAENLNFWLQDTMLIYGEDTVWCRESDGCFVPDSVINGYMFEHSHKINNKYRTGTAGHIYRLKAYYDDGHGHTDTVWVKQLITYISGNNYRWEIMLDSDWLKDATYPVTIDPTFGYTSEGASEDTFDDFRTFVNYGFPDTTGAGTAVIGSVYVQHAVGTAACSVNIGFYDYDGSVANCDLIGEGNKVEVDNAGNIFWVEVDLNPDVSLSAGEGYIVAFEMWESAAAALRIRYDAAGGWGDTQKEPAPYGGTFGMDATMTGFTGDNGRKYSIFFVYTTGAAAGQVIIVR